MEILRKEYFSKSNMFLAPLIGLKKAQIENTYLFWEDYSIEEYLIILTFTKPPNKSMYEKLGSTILEMFEEDGLTVWIVDISEWADDIERFLEGKYSTLSKLAKKVIIEYHMEIIGLTIKSDVIVNAILNPQVKLSIFGNMTAMEYVAEKEGLDLRALEEVGELADIYNKEKETLVLF